MTALAPWWVSTVQLAIVALAAMVIYSVYRLTGGGRRGDDDEERVE